MGHTLVSATPGEPGGYKTGNVGQYLCSCGEVLPGIGTFKKHRSHALRTEAVERVAAALCHAVLGLDYVGLSATTQDRYLELAAIALNAAKVRR